MNTDESKHRNFGLGLRISNLKFEIRSQYLFRIWISVSANGLLSLFFNPCSSVGIRGFNSESVVALQFC
jgi:hypothetical protein